MDAIISDAVATVLVDFALGMNVLPGFSEVIFSFESAPVAPTTVPEPASIITWSLLGVGMIGGSWYQRRRKQHLIAAH